MKEKLKNQFFLNERNEKEEILSVSKKGFNIRYISNPSELVQLAAVNQNGLSLEFINDPSELVQEMAIKQNGLSLRYLKNPTQKIQELALIQNPTSMRYIKNLNRNIQLECLKIDRKCIYYIDYKNCEDTVFLFKILKVMDPNLNKFIIKTLQNTTRENLIKEINKTF